MAEPYAGRPASRSVLLEIRQDRRLIQEGYGFLDEKRMLVAQQLLRRLDAYGELARTFDESQATAVGALAAAIDRHGLEGLQVYPPRALADARLATKRESFLGVPLVADAELETIPIEESEAPVAAALTSPEAVDCIRRFAALIELATPLAAAFGNLLRLYDEYRWTERRARALENVILPEVARSERAMEARLEEIEQEESVRVRLFAGR